MHPYEKAAIRHYLTNLIRCARPLSGRRSDLTSWLSDHADAIGIKPPVHQDKDERGRWNNSPWEDVDYMSHLKHELKKAEKKDASLQPSPLQKQLLSIQELCGLNDLQRELLGVAVRETMIQAVNELAGALGSLFRGRFRANLSPEIAGILIGKTSEKARLEFAPGAPLWASGLIKVEDDGEVELFDGLARALVTSDTSPKSLRDALVGTPSDSELEWQDFDHLGDKRDYLLRLLKGTQSALATGVHILLHGPVGTGKTEFAKVLAREAGCEIYEIGNQGALDTRRGREEGSGDFRLKAKLLARAKSTLMLVNEADDILGGNPSFDPFGFFGQKPIQSGKQSFLHKLLEGCPLPVIWTTNNPSHMSQAVLRRMTFGLEMRTPPARVRERVWKRVLKQEGLKLPPNFAAELAKQYDAPPAIAATAVRAAKLAKGGIEDVRAAVESICDLVSDAPRRKPSKPEAFFRLDLVESTLDFAKLTTQVLESKRFDFSLCLMGPPGTGKSAYLRHLAEKLELPVMQKRASDLLSMWVGGSEKAIAKAFEEAADEKAFLIFDEADSLIADRGFAQRSWEVSQVNEMLTWMESHPYPFGCTTNFAERLDRAARRRFTFVASLDFLVGESLSYAWKHFFGGEAPEELASFGCLTPGDFAVVQKRASIMGTTDDSQSLMDILREECEAKPEFRSPLGFGGR